MTSRFYVSLYGRYRPGNIRREPRNRSYGKADGSRPSQIPVVNRWPGQDSLPWGHERFELGPGPQAKRSFGATVLLGHEADKLGPRVQAELLHDMVAVRLDGPQCNREHFGDLGVGVAQGQQLEHLLLARGKREERVTIVAFWDVIPAGQCCPEGRLDVVLPCRHATNRIQ